MEAGTTTWVAQLCASGAATVVATCDDHGRAAITRGWAVAVSPERRVTLCVSASSGSPTRANLAANGRLAVTVVDPTTYASVQLKGVADIIRDPTDHELAEVDAHVRRFSDAVATIGLHDVECMLLGSLVLVGFAAHEVADQTPGGDPARRAAGCSNATVTRAQAASDGSTEVSIAMEFPDATTAKAFLDDPGLAEAMKAAGVLGIPDIRITELVESTSY